MSSIRLSQDRALIQQKQLLRNREAENSEILEVGIALSAERNTNQLLGSILHQLRKVACADAGTLYLLERDEASSARKMRFKFAQNDSNATDFTEFVMPLSKKTIAGYVASTGTVLNIEDAYRIPPEMEYGFHFGYDESTGYRTKSVLAVPMKDHKGDIIGTIQLINRKIDWAVKLTTPADVDKNVIPFSSEIAPVILSLASQAAVSLENNLLYGEIETLFEGFVKASVLAIESRDPTTSGHSHRVAEYTVSLAHALERAGTAAYRGVQFTDMEIKEIRYASLLHDFGKVGVREHVLVKAKKLYPDQLELLKLRLENIRMSTLHGLLRERFVFLGAEGMDRYLEVKGDFDKREAAFLKDVARYMEGICVRE